MRRPLGVLAALVAVILTLTLTDTAAVADATDGPWLRFVAHDTDGSWEGTVRGQFDGTHDVFTICNRGLVTARLQWKTDDGERGVLKKSAFGPGGCDTRRPRFFVKFTKVSYRICATWEGADSVTWYGCSRWGSAVSDG